MTMKILIFTKNWLGDVLFEVPAIQAIRENFPDSKIVVLAPPRCREVLEAVPYLDEIHDFDERENERSVFAKFGFVCWLRSQKFDKVFLFHRSFTRALLCWFGGIPERIGYETSKRKKILTARVPQPRQVMHQVDYFLVLLKWAGLKVRFGTEYQFFYNQKDKEEAHRLMEIHGLHEKDFIAFHIGANWEPKRWPALYFARLADLIDKAFSIPIVLTGSAREEEIAQEIIGSSKSSRLISVCGKTSLGTLGAFYKNAAFVVSSDSGPMHIASGVGTPVLALFGPTCPILTGPRGTGKKIVIQFIADGFSVPWKGKALPPGGWMERILPEEVLERIQKDSLCLIKKEKVSLS